MHVCGLEAGCSNVAYPLLVKRVMPVGLRGLMMAVMIAALMSDLDSIFNSASTIFTLDIYKMLRKQVSPKELVIVGRLFVVFMVVISIAWVPVIIAMQGGQIFYYIQEVSDYLTPPVAALFLLGVLWHRCNETGAFWGGMAGLTLGMLRLILAFVYKEPHCNEPDERPSFIKDVHFMYVAAFLFWVSVLVTIVVSLCTPPPRKEQIRTTTLWGLKTRKTLEKKRAGKASGDINNLDDLKCEPINASGADTQEQNNGHTNSLNSTETNEEIIITAQHPVQNGCYTLISDPKMVEEPQVREVRDSEMEDCFGGAGTESGRCMKALEWLCGLKEKPSKVPSITAREQEKVADELLHEPPGIRIILNIGLALVCSAGIFLFAFFSS